MLSWAESEDEEREESNEDMDDYWERHEAARSLTSEAEAGEGQMRMQGKRGVETS